MILLNMCDFCGNRSNEGGTSIKLHLRLYRKGQYFESKERLGDVYILHPAVWHLKYYYGWVCVQNLYEIQSEAEDTVDHRAVFLYLEHLTPRPNLYRNRKLKFSNMPSRNLQVTQIKSPEFSTIFPYLNSVASRIVKIKKKKSNSKF